MSSSFQLCLVQVTLDSASHSSKACWVTVLLFLENKLKGLSYVALPRLFPVSYYFRPGSDGVRAGYPERGEWRSGGQKSISPSRKTEKAFRLSSPRRPRSYTLCLCVLNFPILPPFSSSFFSSSTFLVEQSEV